jgi:hypothetical protein
MWFDRIDPRDPLQLTEGVHGILMRRYFLNNANIWLWGLYGNEDPKGWELFSTEENSVEFGGRLQAPLLAGELGVSSHRRRVDLASARDIFGGPPPVSAPAGTPRQGAAAPENRAGLDGRWDPGVGLWFESALVHLDTDTIVLNYQQMLTLGADYTFGLGNGLHVIGEHFIYELSDRVLSRGEGFTFTAVAADYPFGVVDSVSAILYYDWDNADWYRFVRWGRLHDRWSLHFMGFWNPERFRLVQGATDGSRFTGKGLQVMLVFDY